MFKTWKDGEGKSRLKSAEMVLQRGCISLTSAVLVFASFKLSKMLQLSGPFFLD